MTMIVSELHVRTCEGASALVQAVRRSPELLSLCPPVQAALLAAGLAQSAKLRQPAHPCPAAVSALVGSHAIYSTLLWRRGARNDARGWALRAGVWVAGSALATGKNKTAADKNLLPAVIMGGAATAITSTLAGDKRLRTSDTAGASHGANLLLVSESLTYLRTLLGDTRKHKPWARVAAYAACGTQALGQFLLVDALFHGSISSLRH